MGMILLESKLHIPTPSHRLVSRPRLQNALEENLVRHRLVLVSAPAGYGKTTLLADWARATSLPVAWLSITGEEVDVERFLRYLLAAWETVQPDILEQPLGILLGSRMPDIKAVLPAFINAANQLTGQLVFILDDYHLIEDPAIHEAVSFILDHLPAQLHFILASRSEPPLPLARYRARGQLLEIRAGDLHFTREESTEFLNRSMELDLSPDQVASLQAKTEGWIAGLQLAALAIQRRPGGAEGVPLVSGRQRFIADYLGEEVLAQLPADMQDFLLKTSLLDSLCGPLCDAILGDRGKGIRDSTPPASLSPIPFNSQAVLEKLEKSNLFLIPLDNERTWYRYHSLFADFLRGELNRRHPEQVQELHRRAARWYLHHDLPEQAFRHALAGDDAERVIEIGEIYINAKLAGGEIKVVAGWLDSLPAAWYAAYPVLGLAQAAFLFFTGAFQAAIRRVDEVEQKMLSAEGEDKGGQLARVTAVRCFAACFQNDLARAEILANQALRDLPDADLGFRPGIYGALGDTYRQNGRWEEAKESYLKVLDFSHAPAVRIDAVHVFGALADLDLRQGHLQSAARYWRKALAAIGERENWGRLPLPVIGWVYIRTGEILYEWNQLAEAWDHVWRGLERAELGGDVRALIAGYLIAARLKLAEGEVETAAEYLERVRPLMEQAQFPEWTSQFERTQLELWLAQDRLRAAVNWSDEMLQDGGIEARPESGVTQLAIARVLIIKGDAPSLERAKTFLERLIKASQEEGRTVITIEARALEALADWRRGERAGAMTSLEHALRLAEAEGYVRLFADLGLPMARLLQEARSRAVMPEYVDKLLAAFGADLEHPAPAQAALPEPLTPREEEVLGLMAAGLTNREIAEQLVVSPETVKKHTSNIYGKLGVSKRTEAVARARELDLLDG